MNLDQTSEASPPSSPGSGRRRAARLGGSLLAAAVIAAPLLASGQAHATTAPKAPYTNASSHYQFTTLGDSADPTFNQLLGINDFGVIGGYFGIGTTGHPNVGYTVQPYTGPTFQLQNYPGATQTQVTAINDLGNTAGFYVTNDNANYGFIHEFGKFISVSDPHSTANPTFTQLLGRNDHGLAVGFYNDAKGNAHAFEWNRFTNAFTAINPPKATSATATGINDYGTVTGFFTQKKTGVVESFIDQGGHFKTFAFPGSKNTQAFGINNLDQVVGPYVDAGGNTHGFMYANGKFEQIDDPNGVGNTFVNGINNVGAIVGFYGSGHNILGFVASVRPPGTPGA